MINIVVLFAVIGGVVWWVVDYNTNPNGGKAAEQASASASAEAYNKRHNPQVGDCVKVTGSEDDNTLQMTIVGCDSSEAQYKTAEVLTGAQECKPDTARAISLRGRHTVSTRWCFTKV
ncbi:LppU/SCO3897 family protein [Streptomyces lydicus]|uniref:LppU/SCO3897 family protein n=1 Tax=Streptomyces lydicus TaxID=47763 RepID=UPI000C185F6A